MVAPVIAYAPTLANSYVAYDDNVYLFGNEHVKAGLSWDGVTYAFTTFDSGNWIPVVWLSYLLESTLFGVRAEASHGINVLAHGLNAVLLFVWLRRRTGRPDRSFAVALLFALHPLHVESVAWAAERKDLLSTFFFLCMLIGYDEYVRRPNLWRYLKVVGCLALGLLSKSMLVTAPFVLAIIDRWPPHLWEPDESTEIRPPSRPRRLMVAEKLPLLLLAGVVGLITIWAQGSGATTSFTSWEQLPLAYRLGNAATAYVWYLEKTFVPAGLCVMCSHPLERLEWPWVAVSALLLTGISVIVFRLGRRFGVLPFGWLWFLVTLLPVIGILQVGTQAHADRYSYLPHIGLLIALVWQIDWALCRYAPRRTSAVVLAATTGVFLMLTMRQTGFWKDTETLWQRAVSVSPANWEAHSQLGSIHLLGGRLDQAADQFEEALKWNPKLTDVRMNLGWVHQSRKEWAKARAQYEHILSMNAGHQEAMYSLMAVLERQDQVAAAAPRLQRYVQRRPGDVRMHNVLGLIYVRGGRLPAGLREFEAAAAADPSDVPSRKNLGLALCELGRLAEAQPHLEAVVAGRPRDANARVNLAMCLEGLGRQGEARRQLEVAVSLNPNDQDARRRLERLK
jgi:Flp pilus assembly protein TadD